MVWPFSSAATPREPEAAVDPVTGAIVEDDAVRADGVLLPGGRVGASGVSGQ
jgi:hypothetical protein